MNGRYILDGKIPVQEPDLIKWGKWFEATDRTVRREVLGDVTISTVFLGLDYQFGAGPPLLFETMVFGGSHDQAQEHCFTWEEAEKMHNDMRNLVLGT